MGRRQQVIQDSAEHLRSEGIDAVGVQVHYSAIVWLALNAEHQTSAAHLNLAT